MLRDERGLGVAGGLGVVEVALGVGLEVHRELVEMLGHLVVVVEVLIKVGLAVAVEVVEDRDLVAAADVDPAVEHLQPQRLKEPRRHPPPGLLARQVVDAADHPDVAVPGADRQALAAGQEVEAGESELTQPGVHHGQREGVNGERPVRLADGGPGLERLGPPRGTAPRQGSERFRRR